MLITIRCVEQSDIPYRRAYRPHSVLVSDYERDRLRLSAEMAVAFCRGIRDHHRGTAAART